MTKKPGSTIAANSNDHSNVVEAVWSRKNRRANLMSKVYLLVLIRSKYRLGPLGD